MQEEIDVSIIVDGDFSTPVSEMDTTGRQKISKDIVQLNNTIDQQDIINIHRLLHPTTVEYTCFSSSCATFTKIYYIMDHKTHLNKF